MVTWYSCFHSVKSLQQGVFAYSAERQSLEIPKICEIIGPGSKGYILSHETAIMMLIMVSARAEAIVVWNQPQYHSNKTFESLDKPFVCSYFRKSTT